MREICPYCPRLNFWNSEHSRQQPVGTKRKSFIPLSVYWLSNHIFFLKSPFLFLNSLKFSSRGLETDAPFYCWPFRKQEKRKRVMAGLVMASVGLWLHVRVSALLSEEIFQVQNREMHTVKSYLKPTDTGRFMVWGPASDSPKMFWILSLVSKSDSPIYFLTNLTFNVIFK